MTVESLVIKEFSKCDFSVFCMYLLFGYIKNFYSIIFVYVFDNSQMRLIIEIINIIFS